MFKRSILSNIFAVTLCLLSFSSTAQKIAVPSYFDPHLNECDADLEEDEKACNWKNIDSASASDVVSIAIINPSDGVGQSIDSNYVTQTKKTQGKNIKVLGYIETNYAEEKERKKGNIQAAVDLFEANKKDIDQYIEWYGVDGFFFDEVSIDCKSQYYYNDLNEYVKNKAGKSLITIINPGEKTQECYIEAADILVTFEDNFKSYDIGSKEINNFKGITWEKNYPKERFWHLILETHKQDMPKAIELSKSRHAGYVYVTNDGRENPWDTLPHTAYWEKEQALVSLETTKGDGKK